MPVYNIVPDYLVDRPARGIADPTRRIVCENLKIKWPALRWIVKDEFGSEWFAENINGYCAKDGLTIYIRRNCSPFEIANTVAHECRHCWQIQHPKRFPIPGKPYSRT